jgi:hypothetical protein
MKNIFLAFLLIFSFSTFSQKESNVRVDGILYVPKTQSQRLAIVNLRIGLTCYQSDGVQGLYTYTANGWVYSGGGSSSDIITTGDARYTQKGNNLSDLSSTSTARTNLGLGSLATQNGTLSAYVPKVGNSTLTGKLLFQQSAPTFTEYQRTDLTGTAKASFGMLGSPEANMSFNMDYTTGLHKYYDSTKDAMWLALSGGNYAIQYAPAGSTSSDVWDDTGNKYLLWGDSQGKLSVNTDMNENKGTAQLYVKRNGGNASLAGAGDLVLEGDRRVSVSAPIYMNTYNDGHVFANKGGGNFGIGTFLVPEKLTTVSFSAEGQGLYRDVDVTGIGAGIASYMGAKVGNTLTPSSALLSFLESDGISGSLRFQTRMAGALSTKMHIGGNGNIGIGTILPNAILHIQTIGLGDKVGLIVGRDGSGGGDKLSILYNSADLGDQASISSIPTGLSTSDLSFSTRTANILTEKIKILSNGNFGIGTTNPSEILEVNGNILIDKKLKVLTGTNASTGTANLTAGTVTISTTAVTSNSLVWVQYHGNTGMATSVLTVPTITDGTSFVINAITAGATTVNMTDTNTVKWWIIN